jgi:hypothetical protein
MRRLVPTSLAEAEPWLGTAFQLEDSGWKGESGGSILRAPGMPEFMTRLIGLLAQRQEFELAFLDVDDQPIAFEMLWNAKGTLHCYKVGYDERFDNLNPGQLLMHELLRELFETQRCQACDCIGPITVATERWRGDRYEMSQWTVAPRRRLSRAWLYVYQQLRRAKPAPQATVRLAAIQEAERGSEQAREQEQEMASSKLL